MRAKPWERPNFYTNPEAVAVRLSRRTPEQVEIDELRAKIKDMRIRVSNEEARISRHKAMLNSSDGWNMLHFIGVGCGLDIGRMNARIDADEIRLTALLEQRAIRELTRSAAKKNKNKRGARL